MAAIIGMNKTDNNKLIFNLLVEKHEALHLKGHTENIHLFAENVISVPSRISMRGKNEATKYFLIPKILRNGYKFHFYNSSVTCQKVDFPDKVIFVYVVSPIEAQNDMAMNKVLETSKI